MKLEIKHLAPYLPYGLKFISSMDVPFDDYGKNPIWTMSGIGILFYKYCLLTKENEDSYEIDTCKPILRPLSNLIIEIEHDGEKFVPFKELISHSGKEHEKIKCFRYENKLIKGYKTIHDELGEIMFISEKAVDFIPYRDFEKLLEWHIDVFGLIKAGLAFDINTIS